MKIKTLVRLYLANTNDISSSSQLSVSLTENGGGVIWFANF